MVIGEVLPVPTGACAGRGDDVRRRHDDVLQGQGVIFGNGKFVMQTTGGMLYSTDGAT